MMRTGMRIALFCAIALLCAIRIPAHAGTITVTNANDSGTYLAGPIPGQSFYAVAGNSGPGTPTNDTQQYTTCATPLQTVTSSSTATRPLTGTSTAPPTPCPPVWDVVSSPNKGEGD